MLARIRCLGRWVAFAGLLVAAACGSTLPSAEQDRLNANATGRGGVAESEGGSQLPGRGRGGADATGPGGPGDGSAASARAGGGRGAGSGAAGDGTPIAGTEEAASAPGTGAATGASGPGVTDTEVKVGLIYDVNQGAVNAALGVAPAVGQIDTKRAYEALIAEVNRTGGVAGRKLVPIYHEIDSLDGKTNDTRAQESCARFTQDERVFGVLTSGTDVLRECLTKAGVVQVGYGTGLSDSVTFQQFPYLVETGWPGRDRTLSFALGSLHDAGYYTQGRDDDQALPTGTKLGVVLYDRPVFHRALKVMRDELKPLGVTIAETAVIRPSQSTDEIGDEVAAIRAASLQFKEANVTHVQFLATNNAFLQWRFMQDSEKQLYRPRYGLTSYDSGQALVVLLGQDDARRQLHGALSVGWFPLFDVPAGDYSGDNELPAFRRCKKILQDAGETFGEGDPTRNKEAQAAIACDAFFYFQAAVTAGGAQVTTDTWLAGVAQQEIESASTFVMKTTAERHDAMGGYREVKFFDDCTCFHYTSDIHPV